MKASELLAHFDYEKYQSKTPRDGYLFNFTRTTDANGIVYKLLFLSNPGKFFIEIPFYPYVLIETKNSELLVEVLKREFKSKIHCIKEIHKFDPKLKNHLNLPPNNYLQVFFAVEGDFKGAVEYFKKVKKRREVREKFNIKSEHGGDARIHRVFEVDPDRCFAEVCAEHMDNDIASLESLIYDIHEWDVPFDITFMMENNIRCGKYYTVCFLHEVYSIEELTIIVPPEIKVLAFDIETWKQPLQFPAPENDPIMMISGVLGDNGFLITNNEIVSKNISDFEYKVEVDARVIGIKVYNCKDEGALLLQFIEKIMETKPDILTTFNGDMFDIPYIEKRMEIHKMQYYFHPLMHLDCFKWVKRDSYLPMGSQGLKAVTKIKLGYTPDDIDPEEMVRFAKTNPEKLAAYNVSDSIATYLLYYKYVHPFIYSLCTLIPLSPSDVLSKGSGTLCESLLIAESWNYMVLIPSKRIENEIYYDGRYCEDVSYVGGHVECLKSGIYRSDFYYKFELKRQRLLEIRSKISEFKEFTTEEKECIVLGINKILSVHNNEEYIKIEAKPFIYHLDVSAMYPNIILTNRLQPISVIEESECINCDYYEERNKCQRKMKWDMKVEFIPTKKDEIRTIEAQLKNIKIDGKKYEALSKERKAEVLKEKVKEYSRAFYKKTVEVESCTMENVVCQREIPFYVDIVKRFRDRRYEFKSKYRSIVNEHKENQYSSDTSKTVELEKTLVIYESLQVAHKCILNSFYGYVMRRNSRWFNMNMAAIVCHTGAQVIKMAKTLVDDIGITLELDTDGIWCLIPDIFPVNCVLDGKKSSNLLALYMNFLVESKFTNHQYQEKGSDGQFCLESKNHIDFEIDGPYKAMILPSSTEEGKLIKKKYVVINEDNKICELKGFESKRRGELKIVKKFQEGLFPLFIQGSVLEECYDVVKKHCEYYLALIESKGSSLSDDDIFELFSESKNMSKQFKEYENRKSTSTGTALKLSEFLGTELLHHKGLKCEFIIAKYPAGASITDRAIPIKIFQIEPEKRAVYLKKWLKSDLTEIRDILDWDYYYERLENTILRIVILPSIQQGLVNLIPKINLPAWAVPAKNKSLMDFGLKKVDEAKENFILRETHSSSKVVVNLRTDYTKYIAINQERWNKMRNNLPNVNIIQVKNGIITYFKHRRIHRKEYHNQKVFLLRVDDLGVPDELRNSDFVFNIEHIQDKNIYIVRILNHVYEKDHVQINYLLNNLQIKEKIHYPFNSDDIINRTSKNIQKRINSKELCFNIPNNLISENIILSFQFDNTNFYIHTSEDNSTIFTENRQYSSNPRLVISTFTSYMKKIRIKDSLFFLGENDKNKETISSYLLRNDGIIVFTNIKQPKIFAGINTIIDEYHSQAMLIQEKIVRDNKMSEYLNIPFVNLFEMDNYKLLDHLMLRQSKGKDSLYKKTIKYSNLKTYGYKKGFYDNCSLEVQVSGLCLSAILNNEEISNGLGEFKPPIDFSAIKDMCKDLLYNHNLNGKDGNVDTKFSDLFGCLNYWIKEKCQFLTKECKSYFTFIHSRALNLFLNTIIEFGCDVVHFNREIIIINTGKKTKNSCLTYFDFLSKSLSEIKLFSNVQMKLTKLYTKLAVVDLSNQFFILSNEKDSADNTVFSNSNVRLVKNYLNLFFSGSINDEYFYNLIFTRKYKNVEAVETMLNIYETVKNVEILRDSCYYALGLNPFEQKNDLSCVIECFCQQCGFENNVFSKEATGCKKCTEQIDQDAIDSKVFGSIKQVLKENMYRCGRCEEIVDALASLACKCGGFFCVYYDKVQVNILMGYLKNERLHEIIINHLKLR